MSIYNIDNSKTAIVDNKKLNWCWQTCVTRLEVSQGHQTVLFHMLGTASYCAIVTLSLRHAVFTIFDFKKCC